MKWKITARKKKCLWEEERPWGTYKKKIAYMWKWDCVLWEQQYGLGLTKGAVEKKRGRWGWEGMTEEAGVKEKWRISRHFCETKHLRPSLLLSRSCELIAERQDDGWIYFSEVQNERVNDGSVCACVGVYVCACVCVLVLVKHEISILPLRENLKKILSVNLCSPHDF